MIRRTPAARTTSRVTVRTISTLATVMAKMERAGKSFERTMNLPAMRTGPHRSQRQRRGTPTLPQQTNNLMYPLAPRFSHLLTSHYSMICAYKQPARPLKPEAILLQSASSPPLKPPKRPPNPAQTTQRLSSRRAIFLAARR
jgi:hypothetical protein